MKKLQLKLITILFVTYFVTVPLLPTINLGSSFPFTIESSYGMGSIWDDPCTLDGFMVGLGAVTQNWSTFFVGLAKAIYIDKCDF